MVTAIPLHCCTGLIIGIHFGYRKFLGQNCHYLCALAIPIMIHGSYDFPLMLPTGILPDTWTLPLAVAVLILGCFYCRWAWLRLEGVAAVDVRALEAQEL